MKQRCLGTLAALTGFLHMPPPVPPVSTIDRADVMNGGSNMATEQKRIVRGLSHPDTQPALIACIAAALGFLGLLFASMPT